jgi:hypothetical protein
MKFCTNHSADEIEHGAFEARPLGQGGIDEIMLCVDLHVFDQSGELRQELACEFRFHDRIPAALQN